MASEPGRSDRPPRRIRPEIIRSPKTARELIDGEEILKEDRLELLRKQAEIAIDLRRKEHELQMRIHRDGHELADRLWHLAFQRYERRDLHSPRMAREWIGVGRRALTVLGAGGVAYLCIRSGISPTDLW